MAKVAVKNMKELGSVIKAAREIAGIPQKSFAEELNVTPQYLVKLESGAPNLFGTRLFRALRRLHITITVTFDETPQRG